MSRGHNARFVHPGQTPASTALGSLGAPGMAAYFGLLDLAKLRAGETVLVSAASNAAGSMAGQIAMLKGHEAAVYSAVFSPDVSRIVTAGADNTARIWDAATGGEIMVLRGPGLSV